MIASSWTGTYRQTWLTFFSDFPLLKWQPRLPRPNRGRRQQNLSASQAEAQLAAAQEHTRTAWELGKQPKHREPLQANEVIQAEKQVEAAKARRSPRQKPLSAAEGDSPFPYGCAGRTRKSQPHLTGSWMDRMVILVALVGLGADSVLSVLQAGFLILHTYRGDT